MSCRLSRPLIPAWLLFLGIASAGIEVFAQSEESNVLGPSSTPAYGRQSSGPVERLEWVFFPPFPPALGAEVVLYAGRRSTITPEILRAFVTEPFFVQLGVRLVRFPFEDAREEVATTEQRVRLDLFISLRNALLKEFRERAGRILELAGEDRRRAFERLAAEQEARLADMEEAAEWLRKSLGQFDAWNEHREWRLRRGELNQSRSKTYMLEFEVVRAAAYYAPGYSPAQRRLIREVSMEMGEVIATKDRPAARVDEFLLLFSPETTRIARPPAPTPRLETLVARYEGEKQRLKRELRDAIYETDGELVPFARARRIEELVTMQTPAIDALEVMAEEIRRELVHVADTRRHLPPAPLDRTLEERLVAFVSESEALHSDRQAFVDERVPGRQYLLRAQLGNRGLPESIRDSIEEARSGWEVTQADRLIAHEKAAEALLADVVKALPPEEAERLNGPPDVALMDFLDRRDEAQAYAEYDLAALEPGLSPPQRRILLASAMYQLRLVLPPPVRQPMKVPATLIGISP